MDGNIILSIVIPTYRRASFLETTVGCFVNQIETDNLRGKIEVLIGNDSPAGDATAALMGSAINKHDFVRGFNHPKNLGFSKNVEFLIEEARGEYILICGDDDLLKEGSLAYILKCIKEKRPNFILINTSNIISLDDANRSFRIIQENRLRISRNIFVENFERDRALLKPAYNWLYLTNFISANVFKKELFKAESANAGRLVRPGNAYAFQAPIIIGISKYGRLLLIAECLALHRKTEPDYDWPYHAGGIFKIDLFDSTEISRLVKEYIPDEYKKYKKLYAAFVLEDLILETKRGMKTSRIRGFSWIAFSKNL
ncbi:MAG: glycosyltransferase family 2 protein, partial [Patescibacteria group bacterium]|nr:glycosyltransferase family 2 protein [Patescibacteria group bacterium]